MPGPKNTSEMRLGVAEGPQSLHLLGIVEGPQNLQSQRKGESSENRQGLRKITQARVSTKTIILVLRTYINLINDECQIQSAKVFGTVCSRVHINMFFDNFL